MARVAATLPGYASVTRVSEVLHLAPRSVRDLIYAGRLPSLRVGRLHYIKASDLELERRRRLGLPMPVRRARATQPRPRPIHTASFTERPHIDPVLRRQRAAERAALVDRWVERHHSADPRVPATVVRVTSPTSCAVCQREVHRGRMVDFSVDEAQPAIRLCPTCGRRALLDWADRRRQEAAAARRLSQSLGEPQPESETQDTAARVA